MATFTSSPTSSPFALNPLLMDAVSGQYAQRGQMNDLLLMKQQQENSATDQEMVARAAAYLNGLPEDQRASAYGPIVQDLQSRGFAKQAPSAYPGHERVAALAAMGTPSKDALAIGASQAAKAALYPGAAPGPGASAAPAGVATTDPVSGLPVEQALDAIRQRESGGRNVNTEIAGADGKPASTASGYYQMIDSTWKDGAKLAGVDTTKYPRAIDAPEDVQRSVARAIYQRDGATPWAASAPGRGGVAGRIPGAFDVAGQPAAPPAAAAPTRLQNGLTHEQDRQMQVLRATRGVTSEELLAAQERFLASNRQEAAASATQAERTYQHGRETQADQFAAQRAQREQAKFDQEQVQAGRQYPGNSPDAADNNILLKGDQSTPEAQTAYANAYARQRTKNTESGITFYRDMSMFDAPKLAPKLDAGATGQTGGRDYGQVQTQLAPNAPSAGDQSNLRQIKTEGSGILNALEEYRKTANEAGGWEKAATALGVPTSLATTYTNAILLAKGKALFELGVLNGKDLEVLQRALADPTTIRGGLAVGPETRNKQIDDIVGIVKQKIDAATANYGGGAPKPGPPAGGGESPAAPSRVIQYDATGKRISK